MPSPHTSSPYHLSLLLLTHVVHPVFLLANDTDPLISIHLYSTDFRVNSTGILCTFTSSNLNFCCALSYNATKQWRSASLSHESLLTHARPELDTLKPRFFRPTFDNADCGAEVDEYSVQYRYSAFDLDGKLCSEDASECWRGRDKDGEIAGVTGVRAFEGDSDESTHSTSVMFAETTVYPWPPVRKRKSSRETVAEQGRIVPSAVFLSVGSRIYYVRADDSEKMRIWDGLSDDWDAQLGFMEHHYDRMVELDSERYDGLLELDAAQRETDVIDEEDITLSMTTTVHGTTVAYTIQCVESTDFAASSAALKRSIKSARW